MVFKKEEVDIQNQILDYLKSKRKPRQNTNISSIPDRVRVLSSDSKTAHIKHKESQKETLFRKTGGIWSCQREKRFHSHLKSETSHQLGPGAYNQPTSETKIF